MMTSAAIEPTGKRKVNQSVRLKCCGLSLETVSPELLLGAVLAAIMASQYFTR